MTGEFQLPLRSLAVPEGGGRPYPRKITIPDERGGHLDRPRLVRVATPTRQRLTVLKASAGFGKTALLAKCCRSLVEQSIPTAWVSLDEGDDARVLDTCIRAACDSAGLKLSDIAIQRETGQAPSNGVALVAHTLETFAGPFVLAIDDVDLLHDQESIALLDLLFNRGPPNLHMAITCRELPAGLNVGGAYLEGSALVLDTENLRFSSSEIANFLEKDVPRPKSKNALAGWPIAVQIARNKRKAPAGSDKALDDSVANWMDSRLFGRLAVEDRDLLLNIGQFEWMDAGLLNDVLGIVHSPRRIGDLPGMRGLLMPVTGDACDRWELHLLVRQHCVRRLFKDAPERFIKIHHSLAKVLSQRGETVSAARHAIQAGKTALAGEILEDAGVADVRLRQGLDQFIAADRLLNEKIMSNHPRLRFFHSLGWALSGRLGLARENYSVAESMLETHADDGDLALDGYIVRNDIALCGGERVGRGWIQKM